MTDHDDTWRDWQDMVNMTPTALKKWLDTEESKSVGVGEGESVGHQSGRHILRIKDKKKADLTADDWSHMAKVVGYIKRHKTQGGPKSDKEHSAWRYSLMNWGHDPLA